MQENPESYNPFKNALKARYVVFSVGLTILAIGVVFWYTWKPGFWSKIDPERSGWLVLALGVSALRAVFAAMRLYDLAEKRVSLSGAFRSVFTWDFSSALLPSWIGGAPLATLSMSKEGLKTGESAALMLFVTFLDQLFFAVAIPLMLVAGMFFEVVPIGLGTAGTSGVMVVYGSILAYASLLGYGVLINPNALRNLLLKLSDFRFFTKRKAAFLKFADDVSLMSQGIKKQSFVFLAKSFFWTFAMWMCRISLPALVLLGFSETNIVLAFLRSAAINFAGLLLPTPGGAGGLEGLYALFLGPLLADSVVLGAAILTWRVISYYISIALGAGVIVRYVGFKNRESRIENQ